MNDYVKDFYAGLTPFYHLIYQDWELGIKRQASMLDSVIHDVWGEKVISILDVSCGIGTQSLGLAELGYNVTGSDICSEAVERAKKESNKRGLSISLRAGDMRKASEIHKDEYDCVISCDNAVPHLLADEDILHAFKEMYSCTKPGGGCIVSVRDYEQEDLTGIKVESKGVREENGVRYIIFQVWEFQGSIYDLSMYFIEDKGDSDCSTHVFRSKYYAVGTSKLIDLMSQAGFKHVERLDDRFIQPLIIGTR